MRLKGKELHDLHKLVYLASEFPDKKIQGVAALFEMSPLDINNAAWRAEDKGYLLVDKEDGSFVLAKLPRVRLFGDRWRFGPELETLVSRIAYYMKHIARSENDIEEVYLSNVTAGYPAHDVTIALKLLLNRGILATYELTTEEAADPAKPKKTQSETYTFYCLAENADLKWGEKQFKDLSKVN